ncbi:MAG TPA: hypothetical protein VMJ10_17040 [Kofleriaceae bacterium]|nr:hypothetical protein [Kofleriaceae bacterium]
MVHRFKDDLQPAEAPAVIDTASRARYVSSVARSKGIRGISTGYKAELELLHATYALVRTSNGDALARLVERLADVPTVFVGSGGAFAVAQLAADLHQHVTGHLGRAMTPLEASTTAFHGDTAIVMFTASGRHPDAAFAIRAAKRTLPSTIAVVTLKDEPELPSDLRGDRVTVVTVPCPIKKDGFLATNSVLAMATAVAQAYTPGDALPAELPVELSGFDVRPRCLVLFPPRHAAVANDIEVRLHETGLAAVQLADYRNFAHGRHAGLARHVDDTTIIALKTREDDQVARRTIAELPKRVDLRIVESSLSWPGSVLDLLGRSMRLIVPAAERQRLNPARPGVAEFGRKLYHLSTKEPAERQVALPAARKLVSMGRARSDASIRSTLERSLQEWLEAVASKKLTGIVLDYDGTCCSTEGRYSLPEPEVRAELQRIIDLGLGLGFASGRGASLHRDLRKWVPRRDWGRILLGLYNGAVQLRLDENLSDQSQPGPVLMEARERLAGCSFTHLLALETHTHQLEVRLKSSHSWSGSALATAVQEVLHRSPALALKTVASAHSIDIVDASTSKRVVLDLVRTSYGEEALAIGDQGHVGGNDFELLAAMTSTLTVDRCSADPTRCWNLDEDGHRGPALLVRYLRALQKDRHGVRFRWGKR